MTEPIKVVDKYQPWKVGLIIVFGVAILALGYGIFNQGEQKLGDFLVGPKMGTNSTVVVTSTAKLLFTVPSGAEFWSVSNVGPTDVYLSGTSTALAANYGLWLKASSTQIFSGGSLWKGPVWGIGTTVTTTLSVLIF